MVIVFWFMILFPVALFLWAMFKDCTLEQIIKDLITFILIFGGVASLLTGATFLLKYYNTGSF